jgi:hypothetical protein
MYLLTTDLHLDENPENEYRWNVFDGIRQTISMYSISDLFILGDCFDRKDRFSASFVNRVIGCLREIFVPVYILRGNHDTTLHPPSYFTFLSQANTPGIEYVSKPTWYDSNLLLLPFTAQPREDWQYLKLSRAKCIFMHATVRGSMFENGQIVESDNLPMLPGRVKFYSGDVHTPQTVRNVTYVGCPHPVKFGDKYPCRMLVLNEMFDIAHEIQLSPPRKIVLEISDVHDLLKAKVNPGDQVVIRFNYPSDQLENFGLAESSIDQWARENGITLRRTEVAVESEYGHRDVDPAESPEVVLREFAATEGITDEMLAIGEELLNETRNS